SREQQIFREILLRLRNSESIFEDWTILTICIEEKHNKTEYDRFLNAMFILPKWSEVDAVDLNKLESLKNPIVKVLAKYTGDQEAKKANSDVAKKAGLVNGSIETIYDILYNENGPPFLPVA
ncbi:12893_t:CDS:2, partial [Racocetra fulgida]